MASLSRKKGDRGEDIAVKYLTDKGIKVIQRNYWRPFGEIDIIALDKRCYRFIEVKTLYSDDVNRETLDIRPEENFHDHKRKRMWKVIQEFVVTHSVDTWEADLIAIVIQKGTVDRVKIRYIQDIVL